MVVVYPVLVCVITDDAGTVVKTVLIEFVVVCPALVVGVITDVV